MDHEEKGPDACGLDKLVGEMQALCAQDRMGAPPFATLTATAWLEMRERTLKSLRRFREAVASRDVTRVLVVSIELSEVVNQMVLEAYALGVDERLGMEQIPE